VVTAARYRYRIDDLPPLIAAKIIVNRVTGCWEWQGSRDDDGYGHVKWQGRVLGVHRVVYVLLVGPIPDDRPHLDHVKDRGCRSRACCWPAHLEPVTNEENLRRSHGPFRGSEVVSAWRPGCPGCGGRTCRRSGQYCDGCRCPGRNSKGSPCGNAAQADGRCEYHPLIASGRPW
jgi:hypothetical protein